jgi:hypothetical protein
MSRPTAQTLKFPKAGFYLVEELRAPKADFLLRPPVSHMDTWTNGRMAFDFGEFAGYLRLPC